MPFPNFHALRIEEPSRFEENSFRNKELEGTKGIQLIMGKLKGSNSMTAQSYRFPVKEYSEEEAKAWAERNKIKGNFEAGKKDSETEVCENYCQRLQDLFGNRYTQKELEDYINETCCKSMENLTAEEFEKIVQGLNEKNKMNMEGMSNENAFKKNVDHFDLMDDTEASLTSKFREDESGFLCGKAIVTNIGVFNYRQPDGSIIRELRPPSEVFKQDTLNSLQMIPITNNHPEGLVDINNYKKLTIGITGSTVQKDAYAISVPLKIMDREAINDIRLSNKRSLSCGYTADLDETPGTWMGVPYDCIQKNIKYNHVAIVDRARAGDLARIRLDSDKQIHVCMHSATNNNQGTTMKNIIIDSIEYQAEEGVIKAYHFLQDELNKYKKDHTRFDSDYSIIEAERDQLKQKINTFEQNQKNLKSDSEIQEAVKTRLKIIDIAKTVKIDFNESDSNESIKKSVISKVFPKILLDGKDSVYIDAMFDGALETYNTMIELSNKSKVLGFNFDMEEEECNEEYIEKDACKKDNRTDEQKLKDSLSSAWQDYNPECNKIKDRFKE